MKPLLKSYVGVGTADEGVHFEAGQRSFMLRGGNLFPLVTRLLAALDGQRSAAAIEAALPEKLRGLFRTLVAELERNDMLQLVPDAPQPEIPAALAERYHATIAFLQDESPHFQRHFLAWRTTPLVAAGHGYSYAALVRGLVGSGAGRLFLLGTQGQELEAELKQHAAKDPQFEWARVASAAEAGAAARLLYAADRLPDDLSAEPLLAIGGILAGGVHLGRGLVGPCGPAPASSWRQLPALESTLPYPSSTLGIIGALVAFEALKAFLYDEQAASGEPPWQEQNLFQITPGADIGTHRLWGEASEPAATVAALSSPPNEAALDAALRPAFDPLTGIFAWEEPGGREFPLPRRSIRIRRADGTETRLSQWALTPQQVDERTICAAAAALAGEDAVAAVGWQAWESRALAEALVRSPAFAAAARTFAVTPRGTTDPALQMLVRLARLYSDALPELCVAHVPGLPAYLAEAIVGGACGRAVEATPQAALTEALGEAVSHHQRAPGDVLPPRHGPLPAVAGEPLPLEAIETAVTDSPRFETRILTPDSLAGTGIVVGRVILVAPC